MYKESVNERYGECNPADKSMPPGKLAIDVPDALKCENQRALDAALGALNKKRAATGHSGITWDMLTVTGKDTVSTIAAKKTCLYNLHYSAAMLQRVAKVEDAIGTDIIEFYSKSIEPMSEADEAAYNANKKLLDTFLDDVSHVMREWNRGGIIRRDVVLEQLSKSLYLMFRATLENLLAADLPIGEDGDFLPGAKFVKGVGDVDVDLYADDDDEESDEGEPPSGLINDGPDDWTKPPPEIPEIPEIPVPTRPKTYAELLEDFPLTYHVMYSIIYRYMVDATSEPGNTHDFTPLAGIILSEHLSGSLNAHIVKLKKTCKDKLWFILFESHLDTVHEYLQNKPSGDQLAISSVQMKVPSVPASDMAALQALLDIPDEPKCAKKLCTRIVYVL